MIQMLRKFHYHSRNFDSYKIQEYSGVMGRAPWLKCLPMMQEALGSIPSTTKTNKQNPRISKGSPNLMYNVSTCFN
jgi:hypothetical protein